MSENNGFFKTNPSLDHNQSVPIQGSLDPLEQESLDPYTEPKAEPVPPVLHLKRAVFLRSGTIIRQM